MKIRFNFPYTTGKEFEQISEAIRAGKLSGDGPFSRKCHSWLEQHVGSKKALLTHSCTAGLEMAAILADLSPGDEVIMPSFTFVSTANAFVLRGAIPVFVDIRPDTMNLDESKIESAITDRTRVIVPVHYAGVSCNMDAIMDIANRHELLVIEDGAQALMSTYKEHAVGSIGHLAAYSFHETKNVISGEGGALMINDERFVERAEIIWEKGTNRAQFFRGETDKYTWVDIGSSFLPSELNAAFLWSQLQEATSITRARMDIWEKYHQRLEHLEQRGHLRRPVIPDDCSHNAHMYQVLMDNPKMQKETLEFLKSHGIGAVFHYVPLHATAAGKRFGRPHGELENTVDLSDRLIRLPLWVGLNDEQIGYVCDHLYKVFD